MGENRRAGFMAPRGFGWAIAPMSLEEFLGHHYERRHFFFRRNQPTYFRDLLSLSDVDAILTGQLLSESDVQLARAGSSANAQSFTTTRGDVDPIMVLQHFRDGYSAIFRSLNRRLPKLQAFCRSLEDVFACDIQANVYLTPPGSQAGRAHYDTHDVLILQCEGTKRWRIYESVVELPLPRQAFRSRKFDPGAVIDEFVLEPGDVAYLPRGTVHDAACEDTSSLHVTTGFLTYRWLDLLQEVLLAEALQNPELRQALPPGYAFDVALERNMVEHSRALFQAVVNSESIKAVIEQFATGFRASRQPEVCGQLLEEAARDSISLGTTVAVRPGLSWSLGDAVFDETDAQARVWLRANGVEISFPYEVEAALRDAMTQPRFRVGDLAGGLDGAGQLVLVRHLVREGVLYVL